ncbi:DNA recombination protein RmuC [Dendrosporobacter sp. 1207_IL3150]|uniref:DNA recombination protein RmuC n=1 Tax=Dendrosporobacter sp. 1207_IL3150 TaxID=3084054 RepID=UPI002FDB12A0
MDLLLPVLAIVNLLSIIILTFFVIRSANSRKDWSVSIYSIEKSLERIEKSLQDEMAKSRVETGNNARGLREEVFNALNRFNESVVSRMNENTSTQISQLDSFAKQLNHLTQRNEQRIDKLRETIEGQLKAIQEDNTKKLDEMRKTVDEKLNDTLEKRLGESFRLVSERLELVHKGLGEMQNLALGVGDLKRVLTNVKTRGIWGEMQLGNLLDQILTPEQYAQNIATKPGSNDRVEFAIKLPGRDKEGTVVWLPIDAKFPQEDYQRLLDAQEQGDFNLAEESAKALENRIKAEAKDIASKYISVPATTEFAILFLPIEGLYAEVLRRAGLCDILMREHKVIITGPTTLAALLNSLQMGFRTLAIEKRSSEVWSVLGAVKSEFGKFGILLDKTHKKLQEASNSIDTAARKSRTIERKLKDVQELPQEEALNILGASIGNTQEEECE